MERHVARDVDDGVVVHGVDLALDRVCGGADDFDVGAQPLRGSAKRVRVLFLLPQRIGRMQLRGRLQVCASVQDPFHHRRRLHLPRMMLQFMRQRVGKLGFPLHDLAEHRAQHLSHHHQDVCVEAHGGRQPRPHRGPVHKR